MVIIHVEICNISNAKSYSNWYLVHQVFFSFIEFGIFLQATTCLLLPTEYHINALSQILYSRTYAGLPRSGKKFWKMKNFPGQGKVRELHFQSGKF